jgi:type I restriction enzyme S subunit
MAPYVSLTSQRGLTVVLPPISQQRYIGQILAALDDKIALNRRMNQTLEELMRCKFALLMEARTTWPERPVGDVVGVRGGSTPSTKESSYWNGGTYAWATPRDLARLDVPALLSTERRITKEGLAQISSGLLPAGTVLLSSRAPIGYLAIAEMPVAVNQGFIALVCDGQLPNYYVWLWAAANLDAVKARANGTTFQEISKSNFRPMPIPVPPQEHIRRFVSDVKPLYHRIVANAKESLTLGGIRDILLPELMAGRLRINSADSAIEEAG